MILLLGGTLEARLLAEQTDPAIVIYSLAGRTVNPGKLFCKTRIGGFGGIDGLKHFLETHSIRYLVNATHPYAVTISRNAEQAAQQAKIPLLRLLRAPWERQENDLWIEKKDTHTLLESAQGRNCPLLVALGQQGSISFYERDWQNPCFIRSTEAAPAQMGKNVRWITARGPFSVESEILFLRDHHIGGVICRNSGGASSYAKIQAARALGISVYMLDRPAPESSFVTTVEEALNWLAPHLSRP